jgi:hypothetical protein
LRAAIYRTIGRFWGYQETRQLDRKYIARHAIIARVRAEYAEAILTRLRPLLRCLCRIHAPGSSRASCLDRADCGILLLLYGPRFSGVFRQLKRIVRLLRSA